MRRLLLSGALVGALGVLMFLTLGASSPSPVGKYVIELDNAFGLTSGADFKVAGVPAGKVGVIELPQACAKGAGDTACYARVNVTVTQKGFGQFRTDAFCQSRPQSLIGEYFVECTPGTKGKVIPPGGTIPRQNTQSTIPFDLLQDVSQMPYRQRFTLIINELGAAVAGRSGDLEQALRRAVPALTQTDNLLNLLANDSRTIQALTSDSNSVITALANNSKNVQRFIVEANNTSKASATQASNITATWQTKLPTFLEEFKPTMAKLGAAADANEPVLRNLIASAGQLHTLFTNLADCSSPHNDSQCGFSKASLISLRPLGKASVVGKAAVQAAAPTIRDLNNFTGGTGCLSHDLSVDQHPGSQFGPVSGFRQTCLPELAQNLAIVLNDLDTQSRAVEPDSRSPGGVGFSGLQALLWYTFVQPLSINSYTQFGHILNVNAFIDPVCSQYATPQRIANNLSTDPAHTRQCYAWYGPNQPGVNEPDPSNPGACVPDPGGAPPNAGDFGPKQSACKLQPNPNPGATGQSSDTSSPLPAASDSSSASSSGGGSPPGGSGASTASSGSGGSSSAAGASSAGGGSRASSGGTSAGQAQQLLNYLLAP